MTDRAAARAEVEARIVNKSAATLADALAAFQRELPKVPKTKTAKVQHKEEKGGGSHSYKYADLADFSNVVMPVLAKHGLSFSCIPTLDDNARLVLEYTLRHTGGESIVGRYPLGSGTPQQIGSTITYIRRYALSAITGVAADEDDDGQAANDAPVQRPDEPYWDFDEQQMFVDGFTVELERAADDADLQDIADRIRKARGKTLSPNSASKLRVGWAARKAELDKAKTAEPQPEPTEVPA